MSRSSRLKMKKGKWWKIPLLLLAFLLIGGGVYAYTIYSGAKNTVDKKMQEQVTAIDTEVTTKKMKEKEPLNILLMGVDERSGDRGRSDALMVLSVDPENNRSQLISIPRDTRTEMIGDDPQAGNMDKINHAYAFGGTDMAVNTVENFLDFELDYYVKMNMEGLSEMVDAVGGITVDNELSWTDTGYYEKGYEYEKGNIEMSGEKTMGYVRMRYQDPNGDFGRNERQRKVIQGIIDKGASVGSVNKIGDIMDVLGDNVTTNMDFSTMQNMLMNYRSARENMTTYQMTGSGTKIDGIYYLQVPDEEVENVQEMVKEYSS
ncbi:transcriptional regulator LytR [Halobacillus halophilus]|uniref:LytR family transcription regulator n=1 Tax=Halobacillus halophilus (strain ATCC 35676 / DSM 2266 / JCM 20832 / KCTC 3685 / LMG 17431 / NBRC 102448 / NCIMB 2269) TaxID=866895 RepID=I0JQY9_HALH3|nr:LCP family protein [Halobacillus halophilus]ASF40559.1 transcriptional regulator LytR [Halobacillus halophilus]CCG46559.1 LytR family transcription regulator [Halobacillus halophilus DSM 2266]